MAPAASEPSSLVKKPTPPEPSAAPAELPHMPAGSVFPAIRQGATALIHNRIFNAERRQEMDQIRKVLVRNMERENNRLAIVMVDDYRQARQLKYYVWLKDNGRLRIAQTTNDEIQKEIERLKRQPPA